MSTALINTSDSREAVVENNLRSLLAAKLQLETTNIPTTATLGELGFDSLGLSDLAEGIEEAFGIQVPNRTLPSTLTLSQLIAMLRQMQESDHNLQSRPIPAQTLQ